MTREEEYDVSWEVIVQGLEVVSTDNKVVGHVTHPLGDQEEDIFDGIGFKHSLLGPALMVRADAIQRITNRRIYLALSATECAQLPSYSEEHIFRIGQTGFFRHHPGWKQDLD